MIVITMLLMMATQTTTTTATMIESYALQSISASVVAVFAIAVVHFVLFVNVSEK